MIMCLIIHIYQTLNNAVLFEGHYKQGLMFVLLYTWSLNGFCLMCCTLYVLQDQKQLIYPILHFTTIRCILPMLDLEERRFQNSQLIVMIFQVQIMVTILFLLFCMIQIHKINVLFISLPSYLFFTGLGVLVINQQELRLTSFSILYQILVQSLYIQFLWVFLASIFLLIMKEFKDFGRYDILKSAFEQKQLQIEYHNILENLHEAVVTKTDKGLKYFNSLGQKILQKAADKD